MGDYIGPVAGQEPQVDWRNEGRTALEKLQGQDVETHAKKAADNNWHFVNLESEDPPSPDAISLLPAADARRFNALPYLIERRSVLVLVEDPDDVSLSRELRPLFPGYTVRFGYANPTLIRRNIMDVYSAAGEAAELTAGVRVSTRSSREDPNDLGRVASIEDSDVAKALRLNIEEAINEGASDLHFEPNEFGLNARIRVDGKLRIIGQWPRDLADELIRKIKIDSDMKADNVHAPDSGVYRFRHNGVSADIRVETALTVWGQRAVMRLQMNLWHDMTTLGIDEYNEERLRRALVQPDGIILAVGPTGSGKSTLLYSMVRERISEERKIITIEDPVEYRVPAGVEQLAISEARVAGSMARAVRSILRSDPDIVLVGEIRDDQTAESAVSLSMAGRLVMSTLHTNSALDTFDRLSGKSMRVERDLIASSLLAVVSQRLVRRLCSECRIPARFDEQVAISNGFEGPYPHSLWEPDLRGCSSCTGGFKGRVPVQEVLLMNDDLAEAVIAKKSKKKLTELARAEGMRSMREDGWVKVKKGLTTIEELNVSLRYLG